MKEKWKLNNLPLDYQPQNPGSPGKKIPTYHYENVPDEDEYDFGDKEENPNKKEDDLDIKKKTP